MYRVAAFGSEGSAAAACGKFVHVYCDAGQCVKYDFVDCHSWCDNFTNRVAQTCHGSNHNYCSYTATACSTAGK